MDNRTYSKGISWIDDCRIPFLDDGDKNKTLNAVWNIDEESKQSDMGFGTKKIGNVSKETGRFPANLLVSDDMLNDGVITQYNKNRTDNGTYLGGHRKEYVGTDDNDVVKQIKGQFFNDKGSNSRYYDIDKWFDNLIDV